MGILILGIVLVFFTLFMYLLAYIALALMSPMEQAWITSCVFFALGQAGVCWLILYIGLGLITLL